MEKTMDLMTDLMQFFEMEDTVNQKVAYVLLLTRTANISKYLKDSVFVCAVFKRNGEFGCYSFDDMPRMMEFAKDYLIFGDAESEMVKTRLWEELANVQHDKLEYDGRKRNPAIRKRALILEICAILNTLKDEQSLFDVLDYARDLTIKEAQTEE